MKKWMLVLLGATLLMGAACGDDGGTEAGGDNGDTEESTAPATDEAPSPASNGELAINAVDFAFELPATAPAGETNIVFTNNGEEPHELVMVGLSDEAPPITELIELSEKKAEEFFTGPPVGSDGPIEPGESKEISAELQPGNYGLVCFVESKTEKQPHAFLGMVNSLVVE
jgi:hypothetical protein